MTRHARVPVHLVTCIVVAASLLLGACGSDDGGNALRIEGNEMAFEAPSSTPAGTYAVTFVNTGKVAHELAFVDPSGEFVVRRSIGAGQQAELEVELTPGTWELACHELGHYEAGMKRPLEVTDEEA
jgi:uncharacterized cupredoxin-like copper-binding protein